MEGHGQRRMTRYPLFQRLAVRLQHCPGVGPVALFALLGRIRESGLSPEAWLALDDSALRSRFGMKPASIEGLRQQEGAMEDLLEKLAVKQVEILVSGTEDYPTRLADLLGNTTPPILYTIGDLDLLRLPSVGFSGSRKASPKGLEVARDSAALLAEQGVNVVSGYANGVDISAHEGALAAGGATTFVLAEGILAFRLKPSLRPHLGDSARWLAVSEFPPALGWKAHNAMTRNRTICGLSNALLVVESGTDGGTFEAGKTAIKLGEPLFCVDYAEPPPSAAGNPILLSMGARPFKRGRSGQPNLYRLLAAARTEKEFQTVPESEALLLSEDPATYHPKPLP